jgi:hypothetical protein
MTENLFSVCDYQDLPKIKVFKAAVRNAKPPFVGLCLYGVHSALMSSLCFRLGSVQHKCSCDRSYSTKKNVSPYSIVVVDA